jgi:glycosyltransferase involved in cell wall biosynthesis
VEVLLRAYAEVKTQVPLVMIGRSSLIKLDDILPPNALVLGSWPHDAVMGAWQRSIIGLVPSTWSEPFGIVALEAMYMGKPLITSRVGALPEIVVDGQTGLLVPPNDHHALATAMQSLLDDPERRAQMGTQARLRSVQFQASTVIARFEDVYQKLLTTSSAEAGGLPMTRSR